MGTVVSEKTFLFWLRLNDFGWVDKHTNTSSKKTECGYSLGVAPSQ